MRSATPAKFSLLVFLVALSSIFSLAAVSSQEDDLLTVQGLLDACEEATEGEDLIKIWRCIGVVEGVSATLILNCKSSIYADSEPHPGLMAGDIPSIGAAVQVFINWARENPQDWGERGSMEMAWVLADVFPCEP